MLNKNTQTFFNQPTNRQQFRWVGLYVCFAKNKKYIIVFFYCLLLYMFVIIYTWKLLSKKQKYKQVYIKKLLVVKKRVLLMKELKSYIYYFLGFISYPLVGVRRYKLLTEARARWHHVLTNINNNKNIWQSKCFQINV